MDTLGAGVTPERLAALISGPGGDLCRMLGDLQSIDKIRIIEGMDAP